jgi:uncharacterized protein
MALFGIVSQDREFFNLFDEAGTNALRAAGLLSELLGSWPEDAGLAREILICEKEGDRLTHDIIRLINSSSVTPIDREDIYALASGLDDVVDYTEEVADFLSLYAIEAPMDKAQQLASVLLEACRNVAQALSKLRGFRELNEHLIEIHRLENDGDRIEREALASLFDNGTDPMVVIRWKDIFERLEHAIDACERVANIIETISVKHA